jgi:hypothetical protein
MFASLLVAFVAGFDNVVSSASNTHLVKKLKYGPLTLLAGLKCGWPQHSSQSIYQENGQQKLDLGKRTGRGTSLGKAPHFLVDLLSKVLSRDSRGGCFKERGRAQKWSLGLLLCLCFPSERSVVNLQGCL